MKGAPDDLLTAAKAGDPAARNAVVAHYHPWIVRKAGAYKRPELFDDLVQAGHEGLTIALTKYDSGTSKFITYATFWIRAQMTMCAARDNRAGEPPNVLRKRWQLGEDGAPIIVNLHECGGLLSGEDAFALSNAEHDCWAVLGVAGEVLDSREFDIVFHLFMLDRDRVAVGKTFGLSRERVRQIEIDALDRIRRALRRKQRMALRAGTYSDMLG